MKINKMSIVLTGLLLAAPVAHGAELLGVKVPSVESNLSFNNGMKMYAGASLGYGSQGNACSTPFFDGKCEDGAMSYKLLGGMRFNPMFGAELAYTDQGESELKGESGLQQVSSKNRVSGYQLSGVGYLPVAPDTLPNLEIMGKAGVMFWKRETSMQEGEVTSNKEDDGISPVVGLGTQYQFHQNMSVRGEWEHTFGTGSDSDYETDTDNYSVGFIYSTL